MNMMKLYQFELLLSLLFIIVNTTLSDEQPTEEIKGLSQIKQYLDTFGYFKQSPLDFDNVLDKETIFAIKTYQQFFNLPVTGNLNPETLHQISLPRCGVPDLNFEYGFTDAVNISFPKGNKWFPKGTKKLTYGFDPKSKISINIIKVFGDAFTQWSQSIRVLNFSETTSYDDADIKIGFYNITYNDAVDDAVLGDSFISLKPDTKVKSGLIRLDTSLYWVLGTSYFWTWKLNTFDIESAAMHQIGHLLGLDHSSDKESIMYPTRLPLQPRKVWITTSDNQTIQQLYNTIDRSFEFSGCFKLFEFSFGTSLSLGFAFMALMNFAF